MASSEQIWDKLDSIARARVLDATNFTWKSYDTPIFAFRDSIIEASSSELKNDSMTNWMDLSETIMDLYDAVFESDPDFYNDPDFQGKTKSGKKYPSQYTLSGWDNEKKERWSQRGDVDPIGESYDDLDDWNPDPQNIDQYWNEGGSGNPEDDELIFYDGKLIFNESYASEFNYPILNDNFTYTTSGDIDRLICDHCGLDIINRYYEELGGDVWGDGGERKAVQHLKEEHGIGESYASEYNVGDYVRMTDDAIDNYGEQYRDKEFRISYVSKSRDDHMGYDEGVGGNLYDLDGLEFSLYDYELE